MATGTIKRLTTQQIYDTSLNQDQSGINRQITSTTIGQYVDLSEYTGYNTPGDSSSGYKAYTLPNDGYITLSNDSTHTTGQVVIMASNSSNGFFSGGTEGRWTVQVRKGMRARVAGSFEFARYFPLV